MARLTFLFSVSLIFSLCLTYAPALPLGAVRQGAKATEIPSIIPVPDPDKEPSVAPFSPSPLSSVPAASVSPSPSTPSSSDPPRNPSEAISPSSSATPEVSYDPVEPGGTVGAGSGGLSTGAIAGIALAAALFVLLLTCILIVWWMGLRKRNRDRPGHQNPAVYSSSEAAATPPPPAPGVAPTPPPFSKDEARAFGTAPPGTSEAATEAAAAAALAAAAAEASHGDEGDDYGNSGGGTALVVAGGAGSDVVAAGMGGVEGLDSTTPPHDYVLGAGPAVTRADFDDLHARFEREEIGDNSAVLGVDRTGTDVPSIMAGPVDEGAVAEGIQDTLADVPPPTFDMGDTSGAAMGSAVAAGAALGGGDGTSGPSGDILPDREEVSGTTFETQEQMMAGGDGSGAISDMALSLNVTSIAEEGGDVPSLERDPIELQRDRDTTI